MKVPAIERGKSKVLLLVVAFLLIAGLGGGYFYMQKTGVSIPGMHAPLNPDCVYKDPELCKFMNNWPNQKQYSVTSTSNFGGMTIESVMEISGTGNSHMISKQNGKEVSNTITLGDTTYTLDYSDHKWVKQTFKADDTQATPEKEMKSEFDVPESKDTTSYKFIDKEACGDLTCFKYELVDSSSTAESKQFLLFDERDYLLRKMIIEDNANGSMQATYSYGSINISVPSPVKEGSSPSNNTGNTQEETQKMMQQYQQQTPDTTSSDQEAPVTNDSS